MATAAEIISRLRHFVPGEDDNSYQLYEIIGDHEALFIDDRKLIVPVAFEFMERYPHADLGTPGPLVHLIESLPVETFEARLLESVARSAGTANIWMVNRILNSQLSAPRRSNLLNALRSVADQSPNEEARSAANRFLKFQEKR